MRKLIKQDFIKIKSFSSIGGSGENEKEAVYYEKVCTNVYMIMDWYPEYTKLLIT